VPSLGSPSFEISYINRSGDEVFLDCGDRLLNSRFDYVELANGLRRYDIRITNTGRRYIYYNSGNISLESTTMELLSTRYDDLFQPIPPGGTGIISLVHDPYCYRQGSSLLTLSMRGVRGVCEITISHAFPPLAEGALLNIPDPTGFDNNDIYNGILDLPPIYFPSGSQSTNVFLRNLGDEPAEITAISTSGILEVGDIKLMNNEIVTLPITIQPRERISVRFSYNSFNCGVETGTIFMETDAKLGGCGFIENDGFPYQINSFLQCPGTGYTVYVDEEVTIPGTNNTLDFRDGENKTIRVQNTGSVDLMLFTPPIIYDESETDGFFAVTDCTPILFFSCTVVLAPGESYAFQIGAGCQMGCSARMRMVTSSLPANILFSLNSLQDGFTGLEGDIPINRLQSFGSGSRVFPTTTANEVTVQPSEGAKNRTVRIIDQNGRLVQINVLNHTGDRQRLSLATLSTGWYYLRIEGEEEVFRVFKY
jgi:hypothetical protein